MAGLLIWAERENVAGKMSQMEKSIETIINVFHAYSVRLGHPDTLNQKEFKQLVKKELPNFLKKEKKDDKLINHILEDLDTNGDKQLNFEEFSILVGRLTAASHEEMHKNAPPGEGHSHGPGLGEGGHGHGHSHGGHGHSHDGHEPATNLTPQLLRFCSVPAQALVTVTLLPPLLQR
ncbi:PREDICTED: protein S100-A9 [Chrysochloris asiatica]|uniref:Protein S100-A9 n=1 Tax=Chrysochloris asiatica TaxID=185453 RepID=A0A9B0TDD0_CHRAS|nr:PREDICTED: protein S100-A9 [Chrysochloris asiatica]